LIERDLKLNLQQRVGSGCGRHSNLYTYHLMTSTG
jgi:hypothetical protein